MREFQIRHFLPVAASFICAISPIIERWDHGGIPSKNHGPEWRWQRPSALYAVSLAMPALEFAGHEPVRGIEALCWGWWGFLTGDFPWLANPFYFAALVLAATGNKPSVRSFADAPRARACFRCGCASWWLNEGSATPVERLGSAFYFWMGSFLVLFSLLFFVRKRGDPAPE